MKKFAMLAATLCTAGVFFSDIVRSDDAKPANAPAEAKEAGPEVHSSIKDRTACSCRACTVNFPKDLGVPLDFLNDIGHRIHRARLTPDPVELALAAQSLAVAEAVSGKKAAVTADDVSKEALELAKMRGISTELKALALITKDPATVKELNKEAAAAEKREKDTAAALAAGETTRDILNSLTVSNHSSECLKIFLDGRYLGTVHEGYSTTFPVHSHRNPNVLQAICEDGDLVSQEFVYGHNHHFSWCVH
ncbi:hypothetical protein [Planctomicrobium sp. SH664]|uniref:hypothetical protein n=1 Tax=Planctomicrobium sp. SH664 TaxID=3448125 RepID=UPI003F5B107D